MIAVIMSTVSLLTIELNKALAKKDYSSSKDSSGGGAGRDSSRGSGSGSSGKKDTSSNSDSKKFRAHVPLTFRCRYPSRIELNKYVMKEAFY